MTMQDFRELNDAKEKAKMDVYIAAFAIVNAFRDLLPNVGIPADLLKDYDVRQMAYECASRDLNECLSVAAEAASFREASNAN